MRFLRKACRKLKQRLYFTPPQLVKRLQRFHDLMEQTPLAGKYWVCGGMLLGYARDRDLIPYDTDFDFHYWSEDTEDLREAIQELLRGGFRKESRWVNNDGHPTEYVLSYQGVNFEFFEATRQEDRIHWYCYLPSPPRQFFNEVPNFELEDFEFFDRQWLKPVDESQYLQAVYGDWKTPWPDYRYYMDSKAIIKRDRWTGNNQW